MRAPLRLKVFAAVLVGVFIPMVIYVHYVLDKNQNHMRLAFVRQGRVMFNQIVITRRWLSKHGGVYVIKRPFVKESRFLDRPDTTTAGGDPITLRTPDLVTRELSELSSAEGLSKFRIVSLKPINPANRPDHWETAALESFEKGDLESYAIMGSGSGARFKYMAPILTEQSCLRCHQEYGHRVGDIRGGISLEFPVGDYLLEIRRENVRFSIIAAGVGLITFCILWLGARRLLIMPVSRVSKALTAMAAGDYEQPLSPVGNDEIGGLTRTVIKMRAIIRDYNSKLQEEVAARTAELENLKSRALGERDFLINIFERMADGVCVVSCEDESIEYINPTLQAVFGQVEGAGCYELFFPEAEQKSICSLLEQSPGSVVRREVEAKKAGRVFDVLFSEISNPDGSGSRIMVFRDITERKRLEEAFKEMNRTLEAKVVEQTAALLEQERLAALGQVSAGLAHEIRNPLSAIISGISLLESGRRTMAEQERIIKLIKREAGRLNSNLTDFLLFARPQQPKKIRIDLNALINEIVGMIEDDPEIKGEVEISVERGAVPPIWFDDDQLRQLVWNVAINALQAMRGKGRLVIRTGVVDERRWSLEIEDTGPGIPDEVREHIFEPFFSTKKEGTGLGLSIVRRIVTTHGGTLSFDCPRGGGCGVRVTAPIAGNGRKES